MGSETWDLRLPNYDPIIVTEPAVTEFGEARMPGMLAFEMFLDLGIKRYIRSFRRFVQRTIVERPFSLEPPACP